jgi:hypothetical protein
VPITSEQPWRASQILGVIVLPNFIIDLIIAALSMGAIALCVVVLYAAFRPESKPLPPDPRTPAVNLVDPRDLVDNPDALDDRVLQCAHCGHVATGETTLAAIADDQAHFRAEHALRLALEAAS